MDFISKSFSFKQNSKCVLIGEIGVNHNKDKNILFKLIDKGVESGVDILKFQRFNSAEEISSFAPLAEYQIHSGEKENQLERCSNFRCCKNGWFSRQFSSDGFPLPRR